MWACHSACMQVVQGMGTFPPLCQAGHAGVCKLRRHARRPPKELLRPRRRQWPEQPHLQVVPVKQANQRTSRFSCASLPIITRDDRGTRSTLLPANRCSIRPLSESIKSMNVQHQVQRCARSTACAGSHMITPANACGQVHSAIALDDVAAPKVTAVHSHYNLWPPVRAMCISGDTSSQNALPLLHLVDATDLKHFASESAAYVRCWQACTDRMIPPAAHLVRQQAQSAPHLTRTPL